MSPWGGNRTPSLINLANAPCGLPTLQRDKACPGSPAAALEGTNIDFKHATVAVLPRTELAARIQVPLPSTAITAVHSLAGRRSTMSFTNTPVTRALVLGLVMGSIAATIFDVKHYFYLLIDPHILRYHQPWRIFLFQLCYTNSSEVLFACMTLYNMRVIERFWGSRKYAVSPAALRAV